MCKRDFITHYVHIEKFILKKQRMFSDKQTKININVSWYIVCRYISKKDNLKKILRRHSRRVGR